MDLMERLEWLALGGVIGFVLGYIVGKLREIKEELDEVHVELDGVDADVKKIRDERGIMSHRVTANIALAVVVFITLYAAVMSQLASNKSNETADSIAQLQTEQKQNLDCTTQVLFDAIKALNERTTYTTAQADASIELTEGQLKFFRGLLVQPPPSREEAIAIYNAYVDKIVAYLDLTKKVRNQQVLNPFPTVQDLTRCLAQTPSQTKEPSQ